MPWVFKVLTFKENEPLADKNWFLTGGLARYFCEPETVEEFKEALVFARTKNLEIFVLGQGANVLISDDGFDGLVIRPRVENHTFPTITQETEAMVLVTASAGMTVHDLIEFCLKHQIVGLEEFSGIPGTVGGSVFINLHYFQFFLSHFLVSAHVVHCQTGALEQVSLDWFNFGYDTSRLMDRDYYLVDATFRLKKVSDVETAYAQGRRVEIIRHRHARYPHARTCGSFFRNFHDNEVTVVSNGKKMIYVAYYLDKIGVKGQLAVGDAIVSYQHANMIVNSGNATSSDIVQLVRLMQQKVKDAFGIMLQPECLLIGFKDYPLL